MVLKKDDFVTNIGYWHKLESELVYEITIDKDNYCLLPAKYLKFSDENHPNVQDIDERFRASQNKVKMYTVP